MYRLLLPWITSSFSWLNCSSSDCLISMTIAWSIDLSSLSMRFWNLFEVIDLSGVVLLSAKVCGFLYFFIILKICEHNDLSFDLQLSEIWTASLYYNKLLLLIFYEYNNFCALKILFHCLCRWISNSLIFMDDDYGGF